MSKTLQDLTLELRAYAKERDWEKFHSPKNLSMALAVEASELLEIFQWQTETQSQNLNPETKNHAAEELSDIFAYTLMCADKLGIDLIASLGGKMLKNAEKYPIEQVKGSAKKYTEYR